MYSSNKNTEDEEVGISQLHSTSHGPTIVPLMIDQLRPRRGVTFDILASDFTADCKARYDYWRGNRSTLDLPQRSAKYRSARQEFLCFMCCYGMLGLVSLVAALAFLLNPLFDQSKYTSDELHNDYDNNPRYKFATDSFSGQDDEYNPYQDAHGLLEKIKIFFYDGDVFGR